MEKEVWQNIAGRVKTAYNFGIEKSDWLNSSRMAKFIAAIPFIAGCEKAEQTSLLHLSTYVLSIEDSSKEMFFHNSEDDADLYSRLFPISCFKGGDKKIIDCSMALIALCMLCNYQKDKDADKKIGKYNPVAEGVWNFDQMKERLLKEINENIVPEIEEYYSVEEALKAFWEE